MRALHAADRVLAAAARPTLPRRHASALGEWETVQRPPAPALRSHVVGPYVGWTERVAHVVCRREVAVARIPLILNLGPPFDVATPRGAPSTMTRFGSFLAGPHDTWSFAAGTGASYCLQVDLTLPAAHRLLRLPMYALVDRVLALDDVLGGDATTLVARLGEARTWEMRFAVLDAFLAERLLGDPPAASAADWVWRRLHQTAGRVPIAALLTETGRSPKRLLAECREGLGLPPKLLGRVVRFDRLVARLHQGAPARWTALALDAGYYDQAHLIRDFRAFAGCTPGAYAASLLPGAGSLAG